MENILDYLERLLLSLSVEAIIIISVFVLLGIILLIALLLQDRQIKECCKTNNVLRNKLLVFEKRNDHLTEDNKNMCAKIELLQEAAAKQAAEFVEMQKTVTRMGIIRNSKGQFEKVKN